MTWWAWLLLLGPVVCAGPVAVAVAAGLVLGILGVSWILEKCTGLRL